jgi:mono/diheme cytochrome c family protein
MTVGWLALLAAQDEAGALLRASSDAPRPVRLIALYGAAPPEAVFEADLEVPMRGQYTFFSEVRGEAKLQVNGEDAEWGRGVTLRKGRNAILVRFRSADTGESSLRLMWSGDDFPREPVPPTVLRRPPAPVDGRRWIAHFRCLNCHAEKKPVGMPELEMDAPSLVGSRARLRPGWVAQWVRNPRAFRPDATMPALVRDEQSARDIAAYLADDSDLTGLTPKLDGRRLYSELGCGSCHAKDLGYVRAKFKPRALVDYLLKPDRHYSWTRMPDFQLTEAEAEGLAAFLLDPGEEAAMPGGDPDRGKKLVQTLGCLNCHAADLANEFKTVPLRGGEGCLARGADFGLNQDQRESLAALLKTDLSSLSRDTPAEFAARQIETLRCSACHRIDGRPDSWPEGEPADSSVDQTRPPLTWAGEKLRPEWMQSLFSGALRYKPRPWLKARMPVFRARAAGLARGLAAMHGCPPAGDAPPEPDKDQAEIGRRLVGRRDGFACVACHHVGREEADSVFETMGPNFNLARDRLRKDYFHRWMMRPSRVEPGTKMPQMADDEGRTAFGDLFDGDAVQQFEAIWQYLLQGDKIVAPER